MNLRLWQKALETIKKAPEVRSEKVRPLKELYENRAYQIHSNKVAKSLIIHHIIDSLIQNNYRDADNPHPSQSHS